jgi:hypothetical protein
LAYLPSHRLLLSSWTEGTPLGSLILDGVDGVPLVKAAAEWLLAFGQSGVRSARPYSLERHLRTLAAWKELLVEVFPEGERIVDGDRTTGVDLDEFCQYDPLFDVAHFIAQLRFLGLAHFGRLDHFRSLAETFRVTYEAGASFLSEEKLRFYEAIAYFKLARFVSLVPWSDGHLVRRPQGWGAVLPELLSEARRLL